MLFCILWVPKTRYQFWNLLGNLFVSHFPIIVKWSQWNEKVTNTTTYSLMIMKPSRLLLYSHYLRFLSLEDQLSRTNLDDFLWLLICLIDM